MVFFDEPLTGVDTIVAKNIKDIIIQLCSAGWYCFFSTHLMEVAERLCTRIGILAKGQLIAVGTLNELRKQGNLNESETLEDIFLQLMKDKLTIQVEEEIEQMSVS